jgi:hypothetical protein
MPRRNDLLVRESSLQPVIPPAPLTGDAGRGCGDASRAPLSFYVPGLKQLSGSAAKGCLVPRHAALQVPKFAATPLGSPPPSSQARCFNLWRSDLARFLKCVFHRFFVDIRRRNPRKRATTKMNFRVLRVVPRRQTALDLRCRRGGLLNQAPAYPSQPAGAVPWLTTRSPLLFPFINSR